MHYAQKKSAHSCSQLQQRVSPELDEQQDATTQRGSEFENRYLTLAKEAIALLCDSTGKSEILG